MPPLNQVLNQLSSLVKSTSASMFGEVRAHEERILSPEKAAEYWACHPKHGAAGFERFCDQHILIWDRELARDIKMDLFDSQRTISGDLTAGTWLVLLKGRQLGLTVLLAAFV